MKESNPRQLFWREQLCHLTNRPDEDTISQLEKKEDIPPFSISLLP